MWEGWRGICLLASFISLGRREAKTKGKKASGRAEGGRKAGLCSGWSGISSRDEQELTQLLDPPAKSLFTSRRCFRNSSFCRSSVREN